MRDGRSVARFPKRSAALFILIYPVAPCLFLKIWRRGVCPLRATGD